MHSSGVIINITDLTYGSDIYFFCYFHLIHHILFKKKFDKNDCRKQLVYLHEDNPDARLQKPNLPLAVCERLNGLHLDRVRGE